MQDLEGGETKGGVFETIPEGDATEVGTESTWFLGSNWGGVVYLLGNYIYFGLAWVDVAVNLPSLLRLRRLDDGRDAAVHAN